MYICEQKRYIPHGMGVYAVLADLGGQNFLQKNQYFGGHEGLWILSLCVCVGGGGVGG